MTADEIRRLVIEGLPGAEVTVGGDGYHIDLTVITDAFEGMSRLKRQQAVYGTLSAAIRSGALHAVNIQALTIDESRMAERG